jgi:template-activating factor I
MKHFKQNPYFTNKVLAKEYKYLVPPNINTTADNDGLTEAQMDFDYDRDIKPQVKAAQNYLLFAPSANVELF